MIQDLEQIEYRRGMFKKGMKAESLPVKAWPGAKISAEVRKAINEEGLLNLGGVHGDKNVGDSVEYDHLKLILTPACRDTRGAGRDNTVQIEVFNRGITLFMSDDERVRRILRVPCKLDKSGEG